MVTCTLCRLLVAEYADQTHPTIPNNYSSSSDRTNGSDDSIRASNTTNVVHFKNVYHGFLKLSCSHHYCVTCANIIRFGMAIPSKNPIPNEKQPKQTIVYCIACQKSAIVTFYYPLNTPQDGDVKMHCLTHTKNYVVKFCPNHNALLCNQCLSQHENCIVLPLKTHAVQMKDKLTEALKDLDRLYRSCNEISDSISKQMNTPMTDSLNESYQQISDMLIEEEKECLNVVERNTDYFQSKTEYVNTLTPKVGQSIALCHSAINAINKYIEDKALPTTKPLSNSVDFLFHPKESQLDQGSVLYKPNTRSLFASDNILSVAQSLIHQQIENKLLADFSSTSALQINARVYSHTEQFFESLKQLQIIYSYVPPLHKSETQNTSQLLNFKENDQSKQTQEVSEKATYYDKSPEMSPPIPIPEISSPPLGFPSPVFVPIPIQPITEVDTHSSISKRVASAVRSKTNSADEDNFMDAFESSFSSSDVSIDELNLKHRSGTATEKAKVKAHHQQKITKTHAERVAESERKRRRYLKKHSLRHFLKRSSNEQKETETISIKPKFFETNSRTPVLPQTLQQPIQRRVERRGRPPLEKGKRGRKPKIMLETLRAAQAALEAQELQYQQEQMAMILAPPVSNSHTNKKDKEKENEIVLEAETSPYVRSNESTEPH